MSGLRETLINRYIVERTNKAEIRTEWENGELLGEFMEWNTVERAIKIERERHKNRMLRSGQVRLVYVKDTSTRPPREGEPVGAQGGMCWNEPLQLETRARLLRVLQLDNWLLGTQSWTAGYLEPKAGQLVTLNPKLDNWLLGTQSWTTSYFEPKAGQFVTLNPKLDNWLLWTQSWTAGYFEPKLDSWLLWFQTGQLVTLNPKLDNWLLWTQS